MALLAVEELTKMYGGVVGFAGLSFTVGAGEAAVVVGPNGAGKTTLLRCVVGVERPDSGSVRFDGRPFDETEPAVRAAVACALDDIDFFPDLSVVEHLELLAYAHGSRDTDLVAGLLADLGLDAARDQLPPTLSSGQRRRLALAACFVRPRRLLVLDEPEQRLDVRGREWLTERLRAELRDGVAVLLATHDAELVAALGQQVIEVGR
jgi:heme ABC exporter ATP-binding subunit CcmA